MPKENIEVSLEDMKRAIIDRYGPTIHDDFVMAMSKGRIARIYIQMMKKNNKRVIQKETRKVIPIRHKKHYVVEGQMSLFD